jgi:hypothetical protein
MFGALEVFDQFVGIALKFGQRADVFGEVKHGYGMEYASKFYVISNPVKDFSWRSQGSNCQDSEMIELASFRSVPFAMTYYN